MRATNKGLLPCGLQRSAQEAQCSVHSWAPWTAINQLDWRSLITCSGIGQAHLPDLDLIDVLLGLFPDSVAYHQKDHSLDRACHWPSCVWTYRSCRGIVDFPQHSDSLCPARDYLHQFMYSLSLMMTLPRPPPPLPFSYNSELERLRGEHELALSAKIESERRVSQYQGSDGDHSGEEAIDVWFGYLNSL